jgi:Skp family chaperone for outer membrane proteins
MISRMLGVAAVCAVCAAGAGWGAEAKYGVVDMGRVVKAFPETAVIETSLQDQLSEFETERKNLLAERDRMRTELENADRETENKALSDEARKEKRKIAEDKLTELKSFDRKLRETIAQRQEELNGQTVRQTRRLVTKARDLIAKHAEKNGFVLVLDSSAGSMRGSESVVYSARSIDITEDILKMVAAAKPEPAPAKVEAPAAKPEPVPAAPAGEAKKP